jgi:predicted DNA-binding transcriptional regulator AlpA
MEYEMEYEFTVKFKLPNADEDIDAVVERLGSTGCDDALVGIGIPGRVALKFSREAESSEAAILSAIRDVRKALPSAELIEVGPDFVGLTDVAEIAGVSRQNIRKLMQSHKRTFPLAVHEGSACVWHLAPLLQWLQTSMNYSIPVNTLEVARTAMQINIAREKKLIPAALLKKYASL